MVDESRIKAMQTRLDRLSAQYKEEHGTEPTVTVLNELVRAELSAAQAKSRENYSGDGGLRSMTPERRKEISKLGNERRWGKREKKD